MGALARVPLRGLGVVISDVCDPDGRDVPPEDLAREPIRGRVAGRMLRLDWEEPDYLYVVRLEVPHLVRWAPLWGDSTDRPLEELLGRVVRWFLLVPSRLPGMGPDEIGLALRTGRPVADVFVGVGDAPRRMPREFPPGDLGAYPSLFVATLRRAEGRSPAPGPAWVEVPAAPPAELPPGMRVELEDPSDLFGQHPPPEEVRGWRLTGRLIGRRRLPRPDGELHLHLIELDPPDVLRWGPYEAEWELGREIRFGLLSPLGEYPLPGPLPLPDPIGQALSEGRPTRVHLLFCEDPEAVPDPMTGADFVPLYDPHLCFRLSPAG